MNTSEMKKYLLDNNIVTLHLQNSSFGIDVIERAINEINSDSTSTLELIAISLLCDSANFNKNNRMPNKVGNKDPYDEKCVGCLFCEVTIFSKVEKTICTCPRSIECVDYNINSRRY